MRVLRDLFRVLRGSLCQHTVVLSNDLFSELSVSRPAFSFRVLRCGEDTEYRQRPYRSRDRVEYIPAYQFRQRVDSIPVPTVWHPYPYS